MTFPEFKSFPKIQRPSFGCVITEKLDGTNAQVMITEDGSIFAGSRNRWITPQDDNYGFAAWVEANREDLIKLGPGRHYGEWWGSGIQRRYGLDEKRFSLFDTNRWSVERPACCHVVPVLYQGEITPGVIDEHMTLLAHAGSLAAPGFMKPEGIVVWYPDIGARRKVTFENSKGKWAEVAA